MPANRPRPVDSQQESRIMGPETEADVPQPTGARANPESYDLSMDTLDGEGPVRLAGATAATAHDWDVAATTVLRKAGRLTDDAPVEAAWDTLARKTVEGIVIPPLGTPDRARRRAALAPEGHPDTRAGRAIIRAESGWDIRSLVANPDPAAAAAAATRGPGERCNLSLGDRRGARLGADRPCPRPGRCAAGHRSRGHHRGWNRE